MERVSVQVTICVWVNMGVSAGSSSGQCRIKVKDSPGPYLGKDQGFRKTKCRVLEYHRSPVRTEEG